MDWQEALSEEPSTERDSRSPDDQIGSSQAGAGTWSRPVVRRFGLDRTLSSPISTPYT
jgi:hypothetical protein